MARVTKKQKQLLEFKTWLRKAVTRRIEDGSLKEADIPNYTKGAYKVFKKQSI